jgi:uncharacterized membrane-anchored protein YhcB (DUF1043 family)
MTLTEDIARLKTEIEQNTIKNAEDVERFRIQYISKKGFIPALFDRFKEVAPEERKNVGKLLNELKQFAEQKGTIEKQVGMTLKKLDKLNKDYSVSGSKLKASTTNRLMEKTNLESSYNLLKKIKYEVDQFEQSNKINLDRISDKSVVEDLCKRNDKLKSDIDKYKPTDKTIYLKSVRFQLRQVDLIIRIFKQLL